MIDRWLTKIEGDNRVSVVDVAVSGHVAPLSSNAEWLGSTWL